METKIKKAQEEIKKKSDEEKKKIDDEEKIKRERKFPIDELSTILE